ncbi:15934_t:CDS:2, partial [Acaulospora colombiana]
ITSTYNRRVNHTKRISNKQQRLDRDLHTQHLLLGQDAYWLDSSDAPESQFNTPMDAVEYQSPLASANAFDDAHALNDLEIEDQVARNVVSVPPNPNPFLDDTAAGRWPSTPTRPMRTSPTTHRLSLSNRHHQHDSESSSSSLVIVDARPATLDDDSRAITSSSTPQRRLPPPTQDNQERLTHPLTPTSPPASSASSSSASSAGLSSPSSNTIDTSSSATPTNNGGVRRRPSPFPLGPVQAPTPPPRRRNRYVPPSPHIVDIAVETFNLPTTTLSTTHRRSIDSEASRASPVQRASTLIDEDEDDTTTAHATNVRNSPVRQHMQQGHLDKSVIHSSLEEERERQWRRLDEERARSMEITWDASAVTNEKADHAPCKWTKKDKKQVKEKKEVKKEKKSWWRSCFGGGRAIVHDEEIVPTPQPLEVEEDDYMFAEAFRDEEEDQGEVQEDEKRAMRAKRRKTLKKRV